MEQLIGLDKLGEVGVFIVLVIMLFTQFAKMFLDHKTEKEKPTEDGLASLVERQVESYDKLLSTMEGFFAETKVRNEKIDDLYKMHNVRRNGGYAWYPYDPRPLRDSICKLDEHLRESSDRQLDIMKDLQRMCKEMAGG